MSDSENENSTKSEEDNEESEDEKVTKQKVKKKIAKKIKIGDDESGTATSNRGGRSTRGGSKKELTEKSNKKSKKAKSEEKMKKVPLLDQPVILEGNRTRKAVLQPKPEPEISKYPPIPIPDGAGKPLGKIPRINTRLQRLRYDVIKELHRILFGRIGNISMLQSNIQQFQGFPFEIGSNEYKRKVTAFLKLPYQDLKEIMYFLDLDLKTIKGKEDSAKSVLNFLLKPSQSDVENNPSPIGHPKRRATKRNYFDADVAEVEQKKKKKKPTEKKTEKETEDSDSGDQETLVAEKSKPKQAKTKEKTASTTNKNQQNESNEDNSNEYKKPAKKRKRNQIVEEEENHVENVKKTKNKKNVATNYEKEEHSSTESDENKNTKEFTDEELRNFLQKVLTNANLEETTMKTVFTLISTNYPSYDFSRKKNFIKNVVRSLIQSQT